MREINTCGLTRGGLRIVEAEAIVSALQSAKWTGETIVLSWPGGEDSGIADFRFRHGGVGFVRWMRREQIPVARRGSGSGVVA